MLLVAVACGGGLRPIQAPSGAGPRTPQALIVRITGALGTPEIARCHRALRLAQAEGVAKVVFWFEDAGDMGYSATEVQSLLDRLQYSSDADARSETAGVKTVALVRGKCYSGPLYVALCCDDLYVMKGAELGPMVPVPTPLEELRQLTEDDGERKFLTAFRGELRERLEQRKVKMRPDAVKLCEGMVDPTLKLTRAVVREGGIETNRLLTQAELLALKGGGATVLAPTELPSPVVLGAAESVDVGLAKEIVQDFDQFCADALTVPRDDVVELTADWSENLVGWLQLIQPVLLVLGFVLLMVEVKTPGVGLPGVLGTAFLALALFYSYLVGLAEGAEVLLFFLGLAALAVEIFLLPGTIVFGAVGFLCLVFALILSQQSFVIPDTVSEDEILLQNLTNLTLIFLSVIAATILTWKLLPKVPFLNRVLLRPPAPQPAMAGNAAVAAVGTVPVGQLGRAATVLRPSGTMAVGGERIDVVTAGEFIEAGTEVRVVEVQGTRIVVEAVPPRQGERGSVGLVLLVAVVGLALLVAEVVLVSFGTLLILAGVALIGAVFMAFAESFAFGVTMVIVESIAAPVVFTMALKLLPNTRLGKAILLEGPKPAEVSGAGEDPALRALLDRQGVTVSPLRPAGYAKVDGRRVDVITRGEMLDEGVAVKVIQVQGNRVVVAAITS
ncbi:MAG: hypothetical protein IPK26_27090 [Planctomycetes bacterium]|nr:hypothetical protein [Planctomycetota bacterium]